MPLVELDAALGSPLALFNFRRDLGLRFGVARCVEDSDFLVALAQVSLPLLLHVLGALLLVVLFFLLSTLLLDVLLDQLVKSLLFLARHFGSVLLRLIQKPFSTQSRAERLRSSSVSFTTSLLVHHSGVGVGVVSSLSSLLARVLDCGVMVRRAAASASGNGWSQGSFIL